jgi:excisionase family DNA binding protein
MNKSNDGPADSTNRSSNPGPLLYTRIEAAHRGRMSTSHLDRLVKRGEVPFVRSGRRVLFPCSRYDDWCVNRSHDDGPGGAL